MDVVLTIVTIPLMCSGGLLLLAVFSNDFHKSVRYSLAAVCLLLLSIGLLLYVGVQVMYDAGL